MDYVKEVSQGDDGLFTIDLVGASGLSVIYCKNRPITELELEYGSLVGLEDFNKAAIKAKASKAMGTIAMKEAVMSLAENEVPFSVVPKLNGSRVGKRVDNVYMSLYNYYIQTDDLSVHYYDLMDNRASKLYGTVGRRIIEEVLDSKGLSRPEISDTQILELNPIVGR